MLQVMDNMEASCIFNVKVGTCTYLEQSKIFLLTVKKSGIVTLTVQHDLIVSIIFMYYPGDYLRQTSTDILSIELHQIYVTRLGDSSGRTPQFILVTKQTHQTDLLLIAGRWKTPASCSHTQQDPS